VKIISLILFLSRKLSYNLNVPKRLKITLITCLVFFILAAGISGKSAYFYLCIFVGSFIYAIIIIFKMLVFKGYYSEESIKKRRELKLLRKQEAKKQKEKFKKIKEEKRKEEKRIKEENKKKWLEQKAKEKADRERIKREEEEQRKIIEREKKAEEQKKISEVWSDIGEIPQLPEKTFNFLKKNYSLKEIQGMLGRKEKIQGVGPGMSDAILRVMRNKSF